MGVHYLKNFNYFNFDCYAFVHIFSMLCLCKIRVFDNPDRHEMKHTEPTRNNYKTHMYINAYIVS